MDLACTSVPRFAAITQCSAQVQSVTRVVDVTKVEQEVVGVYEGDMTECTRMHA